MATDLRGRTPPGVEIGTILAWWLWVALAGWVAAFPSSAALPLITIMAGCCALLVTMIERYRHLGWPTRRYLIVPIIVTALAAWRVWAGSLHIPLALE